MGIIRTDQWLKEEFDRPLNICTKLIPFFKSKKKTEIYDELLGYGMYKPTRLTKKFFHYMMEQNMWEKVGDIYLRYRTKWSGPDIPIFLFPMAQTGGFLIRQTSSKSGVSYPDKMFLFIAEIDDVKEIEALFVHEYHHVCRLNKLNKKLEEFTLLDSLIIEGLAEYAVLKNCGPEYLAKWCRMYREKELKILWERFLSDHLNVRKKEKAHDELLYGRGRIPTLLGYAAGYNIVKEYYANNHYSTKLSFQIDASKFVK